MNNLLSNKTQNWLESISEGAFKGLLSSFPFLGTFIGAYEGHANFRLDEFLKQLNEKISKIDDKKIDKAYCLSEEFYDLVNKAIRIRIEHRSKHKAQFIVNLIAETIQRERDKDFDTSIKEIFLTLLDTMSDSEQILLANFANGNYKDKTREFFYINEDKLTCIALDSLYSKGIIKNTVTWANTIEFSYLGEEFIKYIKILTELDKL